MRNRLVAAFFLAVFCLACLAAETSPVKALSRFRLDNGLEVFVLENHVVPLARIQISFRAGAISQTAKTAGLFHLYEHMMFKGNKKYADETEFSQALARMGVAEWNGGTATEYVTYYFTVPSDRLEEGLEFWSWAIKTPLLDAGQLEKEKQVVCDEISGYINDPDNIFSMALNRRLFPRYPWRKDVSGTVENVRSCSVAELRAIQANYYVPNNAAIFVGGDVNPETTQKLTQKWFGDWQRGPDPWKSFPPSHSMPPVSRPTWLLYSDPSLPEGIASVELHYRGPDVAGDPKMPTTDPAATYAADVWGTLMDDPNGKYKNNISKFVPDVYDKAYTRAYYYTQRDGGQIVFSTVVLANAAKPAWEKAQRYFKEQVRGVELEGMRRDPAAYFGKDALDRVKTKMEDERIASLETPSGFISNMSFWWAVSSSDYFFGYPDKLKAVGWEDIKAYLYKYIAKNLEIVCLKLSPADFERESKAAVEHGYEIIGPDNAFWWGKVN